LIINQNYFLLVRTPCNGAGTNLKVGGMRRKKFCGAPHIFGFTSRFDERLRDGQYSLVSFLFAVILLPPPCPAICKCGADAQCSFPRRKGTGTLRIWRARKREPIMGVWGRSPSGVHGQSPWSGDPPESERPNSALSLKPNASNLEQSTPVNKRLI